MRNKTTFQQIEVGAVFTCNQTQYRKKSNRTASLLDTPTLWFYFGKKEQVSAVR